MTCPPSSAIPSLDPATVELRNIVAFPSASTGENPTTKPALYSTNSSRPFARGAGKRESVMALGSIAHLQHAYIKLAIVGANKSGATAEDEEGGLRLGGVKGLSGTQGSVRLDTNVSGSGAGGKIEAQQPKLRSKPSSLNLHRRIPSPTTLDEFPHSPDRPLFDSRQPWEKEGGRTEVKSKKELRKEMVAGLQGVVEM
jgi:hypothetical protein